MSGGTPDIDLTYLTIAEITDLRHKILDRMRSRCESEWARAVAVATGQAAQPACVVDSGEAEQ